MKSEIRGDDVLLIVPFQPLSAYGVDPMYRQTLGAHLATPLGEAMAEFERFLGRPLSLSHWQDHQLFRDDPQELMFYAHRSLTAVTLATHLERAGLKWRVMDPGAKELRYWRKQFQSLRATPPRIVALSTSFVMSGPWLRSLCELVRRYLPSSRLVVGGTFYITSAREFLGMNADVFCVGEGEYRLPQIVERIRDHEPLNDIPGLYLRTTDGDMKGTGPAQPLKLTDLPPVHWKLAERIEPTIDFAKEASYFYVETQRGCPFRCEFCTYHTLTKYERLDVEQSVDAILETGMFPKGYSFIVDATATFPQQRWEEILTRLIERGGTPHPLLAFARVTDISERTAALMARAGVQEVYVGQESGDQRMLDAMNKQTHIEHVPNAVKALARHGLGAQFCFIHGFPGETAESLQATRSLLANLNTGYETRPVVYTYILTPFHAFDFATISQMRGLQHVAHPVGYESAEFSPQRAGEEILETVIATSRIPHAPVCSFLFDGQAHFLFTVSHDEHRYPIFRWLKAMERGVAVFLEQALHGTTPNLAELQTLRETLLTDAAQRWRLRTAACRFASRIKADQIRRIRGSWATERAKGPDWRTRAFLASTALRDFGSLRDAAAAWRTAMLPDGGQTNDEASEVIDRLCADLVRKAVS